MNSLEKLFAEKRTENGDVAFNTTGDELIDILFMSEYYGKHPQEALSKVAGTDELNQLFAMFIRDPRFGLGKKDLGVALEAVTGVSPENMAKAGRFDDIFRLSYTDTAHAKQFDEGLKYMWDQVLMGNELAKKWMPRFNTANDHLAKELCKKLGVSQKFYRKAIKANTVEAKMSDHRFDDINYEHVPSLAMIKYYNRFMADPKFQKYIEEVKQGKKKINTSVTTVYDIYKNRDKIDADLFFDKLEKISISCIPILDTSGSMLDSNDSIGKAMSIAYYLAKCSTYCPNQVVSFSSRPKLIKIKEQDYCTEASWWNEDESYTRISPKYGTANKFCRELNSMYTGDCSNTSWSSTIKLLSKLDKFPDYFVVLSDMEFDCGSHESYNQVMQLFKHNNVHTKIVWWNFNSRATTVPELDENGNIFMSGYSPMLLKFLQAGFNGKLFLMKLLHEYYKNVNEI